MKIMGDPCLVMNDDGATAVQENCQVGHMKHPLQSQFSKPNRCFMPVLTTKVMKRSSIAL